MGAELYRIKYDSNEEIIDIVLEDAGSRRVLQFQSEAQTDYQLPAWMSPSAVEGAMTSRISCNVCNRVISAVCLANSKACVNLTKFTKLGDLFLRAMFLFCEIGGPLCVSNTGYGVTDSIETCEDVLCCGGRSKCGVSCFDESTERCCDNVDRIPVNECCSDEVSSSRSIGLLPCVHFQVPLHRCVSTKSINYNSRHTSLICTVSSRLHYLEKIVVLQKSFRWRPMRDMYRWLGCSRWCPLYCS